MNLRKITSKKGQGMSGTFIAGVGGVIAFGILVIPLSLMGNVLSIQEASQNPILATVTNETFTADLNQWVNLASPRMGAGAVVSNSTGAILVEDDLNGYFLDLLSARVNVTNSTVDGLPLNITYTSITKSAASNISLAGSSGLLNIGDLVPTMGLVFGIVLVLGVLMGLLVLFGRDTFNFN